MNPWITGRLIDQMQAETRNRAQQDRLHRDARAFRRITTRSPEPHRARVGLAVARLGLRMAGRSTEPAAVRHSFSTRKLEASR